MFFSGLRNRFWIFPPKKSGSWGNYPETPVNSWSFKLNIKWLICLLRSPYQKKNRLLQMQASTKRNKTTNKDSFQFSPNRLITTDVPSDLTTIWQLKGTRWTKGWISIAAWSVSHEQYQLQWHKALRHSQGEVHEKSLAKVLWHCLVLVRNMFVVGVIWFDFMYFSHVFLL